MFHRIFIRSIFKESLVDVLKDIRSGELANVRLNANAGYTG